MGQEVIEVEAEFPLDEPPTLPTRVPSGGAIKAQIMRSFQQQHDAEKRCAAALDRLIRVVRDIEAERVPEQLRESLFPAVSLSPGRYAVKGG